MKENVLTLNLCTKLAQAAEKAQQDMGVCISLSVADSCGNLLYYHRFGNESCWFFIDISLSNLSIFISYVHL